MFRGLNLLFSNFGCLFSFAAMIHPFSRLTRGIPSGPKNLVLCLSINSYRLPSSIPRRPLTNFFEEFSTRSENRSVTPVPTDIKRSFCFRSRSFARRGLSFKGQESRLFASHQLKKDREQFLWIMIFGLSKETLGYEATAPLSCRASFNNVNGATVRVKRSR